MLRGVVLGFAVLAAIPAAATAGEFDRLDPDLTDFPRYEHFSGADFTSGSVFGYFGTVWALGRDVTGEGMRVKAVAGSGRYRYDTSLAGFFGRADVTGDVVLAEILAGYLWQRGKWTIKAYAGAGFEDHSLAPADPANAVSGREWGFAGQIELWRNLGAAGFVSLDASYSDAFGGYWAQARFGRRLRERFSGGIEAAVLGNEEYDSGRGGGFLRYRLGRNELTLSAGVSGDYYTGDTGAYAAFGLYGKF